MHLYLVVHSSLGDNDSDESEEEGDPAATRAFSSRLRANASARALLRRLAAGKNVELEEYQNAKKLYRGSAHANESFDRVARVKVLRVKVEESDGE